MENAIEPHADRVTGPGEPVVVAWVSTADRMPESGVFVLAYYRNDYGNGRRIRAQYAGPFELELDMEAEGEADYDEKEDVYYCTPGWYEANEHEEIHWRVDETVTHWMPLPPEP